MSRRALLFIDSLKAGGAERVTLQWADDLLREGWQVVLLTSKPSSLDFYPCPAAFERWLEPVGRGRTAAVLRRLGLGFLAWPVKVLTLRGRLRRGNFQLLIGMTTLPAIKVLLASAGLKVPVVVSERNYPPSRSLSWPWRLLRRLLYPTATLHLVQTERIAAWLRDAGLARATATIPNRIVWPLSRHPPVLDPASWLEPGGRVLLAVGTKIHQKGFDRLVTVFAGLAAAFPDWKLVILGIDERPYRGVDQRQALRALLPADRQLRQRVLFPGRVGNVADWYLRADLFVLSSRYEGFPNVLLEAMAAGCACLAVDCPTGPAEIIDHGHTGWLLGEEADACQWVAALSRLMAEETLRRSLGAAALTVRDTYAPAVIRRRFTALVESPGDVR